MTNFEKDLKKLIDKYYMERIDSINTPEGGLVEYIEGALNLYKQAIYRRDQWQAKNLSVATSADCIPTIYDYQEEE